LNLETRMNQVVKYLAVAFLLFVTNAYSQKAIPELWGLHVHDEAKVLKHETIDQLEKQLIAYEDSTSNQVAILIIPALDGELLEEYSLRVAEKWQLGQKSKDNGVLLLIAVDDHKMRIEVGQGLEGVLTDAQSSRIIRNEMAPAFRRNDYDAGVIAGVDGIIKTIAGEYSADDVSDTNDLTIGERLGIGAFIFFILGVFTLVALFSQGCAAWGLYAFLIPFYGVFSWIPLGVKGGLTLLGAYLVGFPILKMMMNRSPKWKAKMMKWESSGGGSRGWSSGGGGWSSGGGGGGFSGGGGSFGGGGSSGSW
jgi:uncharacterized protein